MATYTVTDGQAQTFSFTPVATRFGGSEGDDINVSGAASIDVTVPVSSGSESLGVKLASNAHLTAGFHFTGHNTVSVTGDASTSVTFAGTNDFGNVANAYIQPDVLGTATVNIGAGGELEFVQGVANGVAVDLNGRSGSSAILVLNQPDAFKGTVNFNDGLVALRGLSTATDYDLSNGVLTIYGGPNDQVLDTLRFVDNSPEKTGLSVGLWNGEVDVIENTGTGPYGGGKALAQHVAPVTPPPVVTQPTTPVVTNPPTTQPTTPQYVAIHDTTTNADLPDTSSAYSGPVAGVQSQFISITPDNLNVAAKADNLFVATGSGNDAVALHGGTNVVDAGGGSNFLTGGSGFDTFFLDARNIPAAASAAGPVPGAIWDTIQDFGHGDAATLWGLGPGTALVWQKNEGAVGHTGLTLHANLANGSEASLTLAGIDNKAGLSLSYGSVAGSSYLYVKAV